MKSFFALLELLGLVLILGYAATSKILFGSTLTLIAAFFPSRVGPAGGEASVTSKALSVASKGPVRWIVGLAGLVIVIGSLVTGVDEFLHPNANANILTQNDLDADELAARNTAFEEFQRKHPDFLNDITFPSEPDTSAPNN